MHVRCEWNVRRDSILFDDLLAVNFLWTQRRRRYARGFFNGCAAHQLFFIDPVEIAIICGLGRRFNGCVVVDLKPFNTLLIDGQASRRIHFQVFAVVFILFDNVIVVLAEKNLIFYYENLTGSLGGFSMTARTNMVP
jgi:hypothetical protein